MNADFRFGLTEVIKSADTGDGDMPMKDVPNMFDRTRRRSLLNPFLKRVSKRIFNPEMVGMN